MAKTHNIFISHYGRDDEHVQRLKQRLKDGGYDVRNSSIDNTKHRPYVPSEQTIARYLRNGINWAGTFICLIGEDTHTHPWVNYEIQQAHLQGKPIVGIFKHGCKDNVELPEALKKYGGTTIGWNSLDRLGDIMSGKETPEENPSGATREPIYNIDRIKC
ncbi:MAG: TIR domain-containing protein [Rikenellaceae bacterium]|jgi:hypothetical protein|nr:TIR domain-containing protein [Rikenellaceae bacterium]